MLAVSKCLQLSGQSDKVALLGAAYPELLTVTGRGMVRSADHVLCVDSPEQAPRKHLLNE